jgi:GntR family transcriptional regulator
VFPTGSGPSGLDHRGVVSNSQRKYTAVREHLLDLLESLSVGDAIPPERRLAADLGVSRMTLRRVLDDLVREGALIRRQGSGTFVAEPKIAQPLTMTSFSQDMRRRGFKPSSRTLSLEVASAGARIGRRLNVSPLEPVYRISRLRLADGETMAIETLHVPTGVAPGLTATDLEGFSFYELLAERYGIEPAHGLQTIEPTVTSGEEAELLKVPVHAPAFLFERITRDASERVIEYVRSVYRGDRYQLVTELLPARPARPRGAT